MIPAGTKVYFAVSPADLRKSFDGLTALALAKLERNPSEGCLFVFLNKRGDQVRVLFRDRHGCCVLENPPVRGGFRRAARAGPPRPALAAERCGAHRGCA